MVLKSEGLSSKSRVFANCSPAGVLLDRSLFLTGGVLPYLSYTGDVPLDRVWFLGLAVLNRVYDLPSLCPK